MPTNLAHLDALTDAVAADLNSATLSLPFTAERLPVVNLELKDLTTLKVGVIGATDEGTLGSRSSTDHEYGVLIVVQKKLAALTNAEVDPLKHLVQEIGDYWRFREVPGREERWIKTEVVPYSTERMVQELLFASVAKLTFTGSRP